MVLASLLEIGMCDDRYQRLLDCDDSCPQCGDRYGGCEECRGDDYDPSVRDPGYGGIEWGCN